MASYRIEKRRSVGRPSKYMLALDGWATDIAITIQNYMIDNDRIATGKSISSFEIDMREGVIELKAAETVAHALYGRGPGKFPPYGEGSDLETWVIAKPILTDAMDITSLRQITYLIARKIAEEGTNPPKLLPQNLSLIIVQKGVKYLDRIAEDHAEELVESFKQTFSRVGKPKN